MLTTGALARVLGAGAVVLALWVLVGWALS